MRKTATLSAAAAILLIAGAVQAQEAPVRNAVDEAASVHAIATAARLCNLISEGDLNRAASRMDRVHAAQLPRADQETYLILRTSDSFRNTVFSSALRRAKNGCGSDLAATWRDVESSLVTADLNSGSTLASN